MSIATSSDDGSTASRPHPVDLAGHLDVHDDNIRFQLPRHIHRAQTIARFADHLDIAFGLQ